MRSNLHDILRDGGLRLAGLAFLALSAFSASGLHHMMHAGSPHEVSPAEMAVAAIVFLAASGGASLLFLGAHVLDRVEISQRWVSVRKPAGRHSVLSEAGRD